MSNRQPYIPINCSFYDYLEEAATLGKKAIIKHINKGIIISIEAKIHTLFLKDKVEFMELENGQSIRLDNLISFDGKTLPMSC